MQQSPEHIISVHSRQMLVRAVLKRVIKYLERGQLPKSRCSFRAGEEQGAWSLRQGRFRRSARNRTETSTQPLSVLQGLWHLHPEQGGRTATAPLRRYMERLWCAQCIDTVNRDGLCKMMTIASSVAKIASSPSYSSYRMAETHQMPLPVTNGVEQGCVLAPTPFSIMFSAMLTDAFHDSEEGILIRYRTDGKLFNQGRLQAVTKVKETTIRDFLFAEDWAVNAATE